MTRLDVTFEENDPMEAVLAAIEPGKPLSATRLLTLTEVEGETLPEELFDALAERQIDLDIAYLPQYKADTETARRLRMEAQLVQKGNLLGGLEETDPLRIYLEELAAIPAFGDIGVLAEELKAANASGEFTDACTQILNLQMSRVVSIACEYAGKGVLLLDLLQEGSMGLWEKLPCYQDGDLEDFCSFWIRWYMKKAICIQAYAAGIGQKLRQAMEDYKAVDERLLAELGRNPTLEELAEELHMTVAETETVMGMLASAKLIQRAKAPEETALPQEEDQAVEDTAYFQMRQRITELLSVLPEREAKLLSLRYGLEGGLPQSAEQVAQALGMTPEEVTLAEAAALAKLRAEN